MRVLLIEDHKAMVRALKRGIEGEGYEVDTAANGEEGDSLARTAGYDAIILDLLVPRKDGLSLLKDWRRDGLRTHVLALTSRDTLNGHVSAQEAGADDTLLKPFQLEDLLAKLRTLVRRPAPNGTKVRVLDLEIDTMARSVQRAGQAIHLTRREFALLEFLAQHRGQVVSRAMIWEHLYDQHDQNTSNVVDVYIRYLRTKIDKGFPTPLILTRWGEGYMLHADGNVVPQGNKS